MTDLPFLTPLNAEQQRAAGLTQVWPYAIADRVRFGEIDMLGHVNHAAYLAWFEKARTSYLEHAGLTRYRLESDPRIVVRSGDIHWKKEMRRDETYIVTARASAYRTSSFTIEAEIWSGDLRASFTCICVTLTPDGAAKLPLPAHFIDAIKAHGAQSG